VRTVQPTVDSSCKSASLPAPPRRAAPPPANANTQVASLRVFVFALFFTFGGITSLNDVIIPKLKDLFTLSYAQAMLVQSAFFAAYFIVSLPAAAARLSLHRPSSGQRSPGSRTACHAHRFPASAHPATSVPAGLTSSSRPRGGPSWRSARALMRSRSASRNQPHLLK